MLKNPFGKSYFSGVNNLMSILDLLILFFTVAGLSFTFVHAEIMDIIKLRPLWEKVTFFKKLFNCAFCSGFYFSIIVECFLDVPLKYFFFLPFAGAAFSLLWERSVILIDDTVSYLGKK